MVKGDRFAMVSIVGNNNALSGNLVFIPCYLNSLLLYFEQNVK